LCQMGVVGCQRHRSRRFLMVVSKRSSINKGNQINRSIRDRQAGKKHKQTIKLIFHAAILVCGGTQLERVKNVADRRRVLGERSIVLTYLTRPSQAVSVSPSPSPSPIPSPSLSPPSRHCSISRAHPRRRAFGPSSCARNTPGR
jgi:hypothetical protein